MGGGETIWFRDPAAFVRDENLAKFVPRSHTTLADKLNAILRFAIYYSLVVFAFSRSPAVFFVPLTVAAVTYGVFVSSSSGEAVVEEKMAALDLSRGRSGRICTRPSRSNPFMNVLMSDYSRLPERPGACDLGSAAVSANAEKMFSRNLYRDAADVFDRNTNSRQFYTTASTTIPNDQAGFASWLYATGPTCKERTGICAGSMPKYAPGL